jgi:hypothetical protein
VSSGHLLFFIFGGDLRRVLSGNLWKSKREMEARLKMWDTSSSVGKESGQERTKNQTCRRTLLVGIEPTIIFAKRRTRYGYYGGKRITISTETSTLSPATTTGPARAREWNHTKGQPHDSTK